MPPVFPTRGLIFREPPDIGGSVLGTRTCTAKAVQTRTVWSLLHGSADLARGFANGPIGLAASRARAEAFHYAMLYNYIVGA